MLGLTALMTRSRHSSVAPTHLCTRQLTTPRGLRELRIEVGGRSIDRLDDVIRAAWPAELSVDRVTVAVLPRLTPDTPECRMWRMQLQRELRGRARGVAVAVEYERCR